MKDRIAGAPGRYTAVVTGGEYQKLLSGQPFAITMTRDDKPVVEGTPYSKAAVLPDELATLLCLDIADPTPADALRALSVGKAPAGYGLGTYTNEVPENDLNKATACGWYAFTNSSKNRPFDYGSVMVTNRYGNQVTQIAFNPQMAGCGEICIRHLYNDWTEWEYINPPMKVDVEYRTTERFMDKPVYTKLVNCGYFDEQGRKTVDLNQMHDEENDISYYPCIIRSNGFVAREGDCLVYSHADTNFTNGHITNLLVRNEDYAGDCTVVGLAQIWYYYEVM